MKSFWMLLGAIASITLATMPERGNATIGCYINNDSRYPRASLIVENNLSLPVEVTPNWFNPSSILRPLMPRTPVAPLTEQRLLYSVGIGRNIVQLRVIVDGTIYTAERTVYVNNELDATCRKTYRIVVTQSMFPGATIPTVPRPVTTRYLGCFADNRSAAPGGLAGRDLNGDVFNSPGMTVNACVARCRAGNFAFAGVQYGTWCFCGNRYNRDAPSNACDMRCAGNPQENCGGEWANGIYALQ